MIDMMWLDKFPDNDLAASFSILNRFAWNLKISSSEHKWALYAGDSLLFKSDSKEAFDAFLYGLGVTYMSYDSFIIDGFEDVIRKFLGDDLDHMRGDNP